MVLGEGGLKMIIDFLESGDDELIAGALHTIANVASSEEVQQQIIELGGVPNIIKLMNSINVMIQKGATTAIANLVANRTFVVECLEWCAVECSGGESNGRLVSRTAAAAAPPEEYHQMLLEAGLLDPLVLLAKKSKNPEVQFRVTSALNNLAANRTSSSWCLLLPLCVLLASRTHALGAFGRDSRCQAAAQGCWRRAAAQVACSLA